MIKRNSFFCPIIAATLFLAACTGKTETEKQEKIIPVKVMEITVSTTNSEKNYVGTVEESLSTSLGFSGMGTVEQVLVSEGQTVRKGQLLAKLDGGTAQSSYDAAQATLHQAQDAYDRMSKLHENGSIPDIKFVEVETGLQQAKAQATRAKKALDDCHLYAPHSGIIAERSVEAGANVMPGLSVFKLVSVDKVNIKISIPENEIGTTVLGQEATIDVPALSDQTFSGKIEQKGISANPISHTYEVKIGINNPQLKLMPGMVCKVHLKQNVSEAGIVVPNRAVQVSHDGKRFVWLAENGTAKRRIVQTGTLSDYGVSIIDGLTIGEKLIVEGYQKVSEGMKINYK
ncbi:MAG: Solvent efflux pump periplasmic linker SrpA [Candidatus Ordinivivax streblomastigis]|uniref:Solvent efflux pump periplasmic linker SrpA n=1 Tax=Candidatus Ordinivivax streblomastigis TaxID=2540710 RepID=A0A5M8NVS0_9BACT|nr:MAG: Solvent efflux pump periplasmic linker SrpA [Candidatus Ordinivivax streblomastigis]